MSAWAQDTGHFARRLEDDGGGPRDFAERRFFGRYLGGILDEAIASGLTTLVPAMATRASHDGSWQVHLTNGTAVTADALVLANGNQAPEPLRALGAAGDRLIANPWGAEARAAIADLAATGVAALIVGTGLTMVDVAVSLDAAGYRGRAVALSRRGLIPRSHADVTAAPIESAEVPKGNVPALLACGAARPKSAGVRRSTRSGRTAIGCGKASIRTSSAVSFATPAHGGTFTAIASRRRSRSALRRWSPTGVWKSSRVD